MNADSRTPVVFVVPVLQRAGAENIVAALARGLPAQGFSPSVLCLEDERASVGEELVAAGIPVCGLRLSRRRSLACARAIARQLPAQRPLIVHSHLFHANIATRLAVSRLPRAARDGVQVLSTVHIVERRFRPWQFLFDKLTARYARVEVCVSRAVAKYQRQRTGLPESFFHVIENGIDTERFSSKWAEQRRPGAEVVSVGRLDPQKDFPTLLHAWRIVEAERPFARLKVAGLGPETGRLLKLARQLRLKNVGFLGFVDDVPNLLRASELYVQSSAWEGFGVAVVEAMACGLPVVATAVDSVPEIVAHGETGLLVPRGDSEQMAAAILEILGNPWHGRQLGLAGRAAVTERFSVERMIADYAQLYRALMLP